MLSPETWGLPLTPLILSSPHSKHVYIHFTCFHHSRPWSLTSLHSRLLPSLQTPSCLLSVCSPQSIGHNLEDDQPNLKTSLFETFLWLPFKDRRKSNPGWRSPGPCFTWSQSTSPHSLWLSHGASAHQLVSPQGFCIHCPLGPGCFSHD